MTATKTRKRTTTTTTTIRTREFFRSASIEPVARETRAGAADDGPVAFRTVFSSERAEVPRDFIINGETVRALEVLSHAEGAADLSFLNSGRAPLLSDHLPDQQVGRLESAAIVDGRGIGEGVLSRAERARDEVLDIQDGIRRNTSVGYFINEIRLEPRPGLLPIARVLKWMPFEVSVLSIPADMLESTIEARTGSGREHVTRVLQEHDMPDDNKNNEQNRGAGGGTQVTLERPSQADEEARIRKEVQEAERSRRNAITTLAAAHNRQDLGEAAIRAGHSLELFKGIMLDTLAENAKLETPASKIGLSAKEQKQFSFARALEFMTIENPNKEARDKAGFELECSSAVAQQIGKQARGLFIPQDMLETGFDPTTLKALMTRNVDGAHLGAHYRTHSVGAAGLGGNLVGTDHLGGSFIEVLYNAMQVRNMGARVLSGLRGNVQIPRRTAGGGTRWTSEQSLSVTGANLDIGDSTFDQVPLVPRDLTTTSLMTRNLILQSDPSIEALIRSDLAMAIALSADAAAINGDNTADPNVPDGIFNAAGTNNVSLGTPNGGAITYALAVEFIRVVLAANALGVGNLGWLMNANGWARGMTVSRDPGSGQFLLKDGRFMEHRYELSEQVPSNLVEGASGAVLNGIIFGAWSSMMIGEWGVLELQVDPYTAIATGAVRINAFMTMDIALRYPQAFSFSVDMT